MVYPEAAEARASYGDPEGGLDQSSGFSGKKKSFLWHDIEAVSLDSTQGTPYLKFELKASAGLSDKASFWTGASPAKPILALSPFTPEVQEKLLDAVNTRLRRASGTSEWKEAVAPNQLVIERQFHEQLAGLMPHTWVTYSLIAINVLIWLVTLRFGASFLQTSGDRLLVWGGNAAVGGTEG